MVIFFIFHVPFPNDHSQISCLQALCIRILLLAFTYSILHQLFSVKMALYTTFFAIRCYIVQISPRFIVTFFVTICNLCCDLQLLLYLLLSRTTRTHCQAKRGGTALLFSYRYIFTLGKYSFTKSTSDTWKLLPFKWASAPASVVKVKVSL